MRHAQWAENRFSLTRAALSTSGRFLGMLQKRSFEQRTLRYADVRDMMEEARPVILEKAQAMGKA